MTAQHKTEKAARLSAFAAALANRHNNDARSNPGSTMFLATVSYQNATPTAAPLVVTVTRN